MPDVRPTDRPARRLWQSRRRAAERARARRDAELLALARGAPAPPWTVLYLRRLGYVDGDGLLTGAGRAAAAAAGERRA
jgi:hypothetical protein